jgi:hypothetical protein
MFYHGQKVTVKETCGGQFTKGVTYIVGGRYHYEDGDYTGIVADDNGEPNGWPHEMFEAVVSPSIVKDLRLKPQTKTVLRHLRKGQHISPMQALVVYSISRLAPCIHDIRRAGYNVSTEVKRDAQGHKYAQYVLVA